MYWAEFIDEKPSYNLNSIIVYPNGVWLKASYINEKWLDDKGNILHDPTYWGEVYLPTEVIFDKIYEPPEYIKAKKYLIENEFTERRVNGMDKEDVVRAAKYTQRRTKK